MHTFTADDYKVISSEMLTGGYNPTTKALGEALRRADDGNANKLAQGFNDEFQKYLETAQHKAKVERLKMIAHEMQVGSWGGFAAELGQALEVALDANDIDTASKISEGFEKEFSEYYKHALEKKD